MNTKNFDSPPSLLRSGKQKRTGGSTTKPAKKQRRTKNNSCPPDFTEPRISAYYYPVTPKGQTTPTSNRFSPLASLMESKEHDVAQAGVVTTGSATPTQHLSPGTQLPTTQTDQHVMQGNAQPMHQRTESGAGRPLPDLGQAGSSSVTFIAQTELSTQSSNQGGPPPGLMQMQGQSYMQAGASQGLQIQPQLSIPAGHVQPGIQMQQSGQAQMHNGTQQQYHQVAGNVAQRQQPNGQPQTYYNSSNGSNSDPAAGTMNQQHRQPPTTTRPMKRSYPGDDPMLEARFMAIEYNVQQGHITQNRAEEDLNSNKVRICPCPYRVPATHDQLTKWYKDTFADKIAAPPGIDLCPPGTTFQQVNLPNGRGPTRETLKMVVMVEFPTSLVPNFYKAWKWDGEGKGGLQLIADAHKNYERVEKAKGDVNDHAKHGFCLSKGTSVRPQLPTRHNLCCKYVKDLIRAMVKVMQERDGGNTSVGAPWMNRSSGRLPQLQPSRQGQDLKIRILITPAADGLHPVYKNEFVNYDQLQTDTRTAQYTVALGKQPTNVTGKIYDFKKQHELMDEARQVVGTRQRELSPAHVPYQPNPPNQGYSQAEFVNNDPNIPPVSY